MQDIKDRVGQLNNRIGIDLSHGTDNSAAVIYTTKDSLIKIGAIVTDILVIDYIAEQQNLIKELTEREAKLVELLQEVVDTVGGCHDCITLSKDEELLKKIEELNIKD